jgi:cytochrome c-type biogenesis protein CcmH
LKASVPADSELGKNIGESIAEARARGGLGDASAGADARKTPQAPSAAASVQGTVQLDPTLAARAAPDDVVFVFARASEGPRVPLAVFKLQAKDLPARFVLDDSLAMAPQFRLSNFKTVLVNARLSKSGSANPAAGDLEGKGVAVGLGARDVLVTIDRVIQ